MNIWIINEYAGSPSYGMTFRHYYLAKAFKNNECHTTIISAAYSHFLKKYPQMDSQIFKNEKVDDVNFLWIKVMHYSKSFDKKRIFKWFEFMFKLFFISRYIESKPDVIICSPSAPFSILPAYFLAKKHNAKLVFEVRDIWPLTLIEIGGFSKYNPFIVFMGWFEKFALKKSDLIVSNLQNYSKHIKELGINKKAFWIPNGVDLEEMQYGEALDDKIIQMIPKDKFIIGYTGKLGVSNAISYLIKAAKLLQENHNIHIVIVGDGSEKDTLISYCLRHKLTNITFIDPIPKIQIQSMLKLFDICYIGWLEKKIYQYGIAANKIFDYMYSATPILHSMSMANDIVYTVKCGKNVRAENCHAIKDAIEELSCANKDKIIAMGQNGKEYVIRYHSYNTLAKKYIDLLEKN